jgi:hypothetical protein
MSTPFLDFGVLDVPRQIIVLPGLRVERIRQLPRHLDPGPRRCRQLLDQLVPGALRVGQRVPRGDRGDVAPVLELATREHRDDLDARLDGLGDLFVHHG